MNIALEWKLTDESFVDMGFAITKAVTEVVSQQMPDLADMFPFRKSWKLRGHLSDKWIAVTIQDETSSQVPSIGQMDDGELIKLSKLILPFEVRDYDEIYKLLGPSYYSFGRFTYVGPYNHPYASWPHISQHLTSWLNQIILPEVLERNRARILRAIPSPPQFDLQAITQALWVLECEETSKQGTAFYLSGGKLITCQHVLGSKTVAFKSDNISQKFPVRIVSQNSTIDLAILNIDSQSPVELAAGSADQVKQMDHVAIAGFPNYRYGDTGIIVPGLTVGFRMVSGIRRILTNAAIVAGNSGGPVLDSGNRVIGVAVTGSDCMEDSQQTENHGIIPIDALRFITK